MRNADCRSLPSSAQFVVLMMLTGLLSGCAQLLQLTPSPGDDVVVTVKIPPLINIDSNITEFKLYPVAGSAMCAQPLETGIKAKVANSRDWLPHIEGIPDLEGPLEIKGKVENCDVRMGYGVITGELTLWHNAKSLYQQVVREETTRSGESPEGVRGILTERVVANFVKLFVWTEKKKLRKIIRIGDDEADLNAAKNGNWNLAIDGWTKRIGQIPTADEAYYNRAVAHEAVGQPKKAVEDLRKAVQMRPDKELYGIVLADVEKTYKPAPAR